VKKPAQLFAFILCMCAFLFCILLTVVPLNRLAGTAFLASLPTNIPLTIVGTWLPTDLHLATNIHASQVNTDTIEFLALMVLVYLFYALTAYGAQRYLATQTTLPLDVNEAEQHHAGQTLLRLLWLGAIFAGMVYVLTPSLLSRDAAVYAGYGRIIVTYHANPYYTPLSAFPHDPLFQLDDWRDALAAYGPIWLIVCAVSTLIAGKAILHYIFFYRLLGLASHVVNIALVTFILRKTRRSPRIVVLGTLLYAWNPLVLLESCLGGHNDTVMMSCVLLGVLLCVRAEQDAFTHARYYLPPVVAFTCATLIKFTAAPFIALYLVLLACFVLKNALVVQQQNSIQLCFAAMGKVCTVALVSILLIVVFYMPLWIGHTASEIVASLGSPPSSRLAFGSILLALQRVALVSHNADGFLVFFSQHSTWNIIDAIVVGGVFAIGIVELWKVPSTLTMVRVALALLGALLIVTPWFFPWYVLWLVSLAAITLPTPHERVTLALIGGALTFSGSAFFVYLFRGYAPVGGWIGFTSLTTIGPPLVIFLFILLAHPESRPRSPHRSSQE